MTPTQIAELESEFIRRAHADKAAGHELNASTWQLAASLLIGAASNASAPLLTSKEIAPLSELPADRITLAEFDAFAARVRAMIGVTNQGALLEREES